MSKPLEIRRRLPDGTFGEWVKPFGGESDAEKLERLEKENLDMMEANLMLYLENESLKDSDMTNKEAIIELYSILLGGM